MNDSEWRSRALCGLETAELFWLTDGNQYERRIHLTADNLRAIALCKQCPVLAECENYELDHLDYTRRIAAGKVWHNGRPKEIRGVLRNQPKETKPEGIQRILWGKPPEEVQAKLTVPERRPLRPARSKANPSPTSKPGAALCRNGHLYTEENTGWGSSNNGKFTYRICKTCNREAAARSRARKRAREGKAVYPRSGNTCRNGHPRTEENTSRGVTRSGSTFQICLTCNREKVARYRAQ